MQLLHGSVGQLEDHIVGPGACIKVTMSQLIFILTLLVYVIGTVYFIERPIALSLCNFLIARFAKSILLQEEPCRHAMIAFALELALDHVDITHRGQ